MNHSPASQEKPARCARIWWSILLTLTVTSGSAAQDVKNEPDGASPTGRSVSTTPWFDAEQGHLIPVPIEAQQYDSENRESRWLPKAKRLPKPANTGANAGKNSTGARFGQSGIFGTSLSLTNLVGWILLIAIIGLAVGVLFYVLSRSEFAAEKSSHANARNGSKSPDEQTLERMKHLPAELRRTDVNLRSEAHRLMQSGNYDQAIILLFGHQLLLLDRFGMLRLNRGKTNRKYVRETRSSDPTAAKSLQTTVTAFERSYFGRHTISQREFANIWQANQQLEKGIEQKQGEAA